MKRPLLRKDMGYESESPDTSAIRGFLYACMFTGLIVLVFIAGCFIFPKKASAETISAKPNKLTASWYGVTGDNCDPWKHTTTANGERFNENAMTAASFKYPIGTRLRVTNLRNKKSVIVRINDRGPSKRLCRKGRIIDLTRGSFAKIADLRDGIIPIKIEIIRIHHELA